MAKTIIAAGLRFVVSDAEYALIDWGTTGDDFVRFETTSGGDIAVNLQQVTTLTTPGVEPPPGSFPGFRVNMIASKESIDAHVNQATRDALVAALQGPGSEDQVLQFTTLEGEDVRIVTRNMGVLYVEPETLEVPDPP